MNNKDKYKMCNASMTMVALGAGGQARYVT